MKKICVLTDSIYTLGGIQRVVTSLCNKLLSCDYDITILCQYDVKKKDRVNYKLNENISVKIIDNSFFGIDKIIFLPIRAVRFIIVKLKLKKAIFNKIIEWDYKIFKRWKMIKYINNNNFDYVLAEGLSNCIYISNFKNKINSVIIGCWHSSYDSYIPNYNNDNILKSLKLLDKTIVLSEDDRKKIFDRFGVDTTCIYNFITSDKKLTSSLNNKVMISVGRYSEEKGFDRLINIFNIFSKNNPDWVLYIVGDGNDRKKLQSLIDSYKLNDKIFLTGKTDNVEYYYKKAAIFLLSSYVEGFPMVVVEAMSYGLPIIAFDIPVLHEMLSYDACIIEQDDVEKYVDLMNKLATDIKLRKKISKLNKEKCKDFYDNVIIKKWIDNLK